MDAPAPQPRPPRVSVIIATYNWSSVLRHAIASALAQTFTDFELLVVGDACTDDSAEVVASFGDRRAVWHNRAENFGSQVGPNNTGLALARGTYVAYLGHDDLWLPAHLALLVDRLDEAGPERADLAYTLATIVLPDGGRWISGLTAPGGPGPSEYVVPSSLMHRRTVVERIGPWADHRRIGPPPDVEWQLRARGAGLRFARVDRLTVVKFPSTQRKGSYVTRKDDEQRGWWRRMGDDAAFAEHELVALLRRALDGELPTLAFDQRFVPPGHAIRRNRQLRGLEPGPPLEASEPLPEGLDARHFPLRIAAAPSRVEPGTPFLLEVEVTNRTELVLSSEPPVPVHLSYHWLGADGAIAVHDGRRSVLDEPLPPGQARTFLAEVVPPEPPGEYRLRVALVQEHVRWLDAPEDTLPEASIHVLGAGAEAASQAAPG
jgi:glycosyltransferase involved in cell wall biosynthesis